ncbi:MAG: hypothetical protein C4293_04170 [Nitrospiraceae bacterium]
MLSSLIRFGTSTWAYAGWQGLVYTNSYPKGRFAQESLGEYARYEYRGERLFRTVGLDQTFYRPPLPGQLARYAEQLPPGFDMCSKVWQELTVPQFASHPRYGAKAGRCNPRFLDVDLFIAEVLPSYLAEFKGHTGPFIFEFQRTGIEPTEFLSKLDRFFDRIPKDFSYGVEVRNSGFLNKGYFSLLAAHRVAHVYNHWTWMPPLKIQHQRLGQQFTASFVLIRLLTPLGVRYEDAVQRAKPYNRLVQVLPEMRADTLGLIHQAVEEQRRAYVLVNNRAEGSAPLTIQALVDELRSG